MSGVPRPRLAFLAVALLCGAFRTSNADTGVTMTRDDHLIVDSGAVRITSDGAELELFSGRGGGILIVTSRPAGRWPFQSGDVLLASGENRLASPEAFFKLLRRAKPTDSIDVTIRRRDRLMTIAIPVSAYRCCVPPMPPAPPGTGRSRDES